MLLVDGRSPLICLAWVCLYVWVFSQQKRWCIANKHGEPTHNQGVAQAPQMGRSPTGIGR